MSYTHYCSLWSFCMPLSSPPHYCLQLTSHLNTISLLSYNSLFPIILTLSSFPPLFPHSHSYLPASRSLSISSYIQAFPQISPLMARSRNFNGCWTCRLRKIKCDATRPVCLRCKKAKLVCKGYSIVLAWADLLTVSQWGDLVSIPTARGSSHDDSGLRRNVELVRFPKSLQFDSFDRLNRVVLLVDDNSKNLANGVYFEGPFGVYDSSGGLSGKISGVASSMLHSGSTDAVSMESGPLYGSRLDSSRNDRTNRPKRLVNTAESPSSSSITASRPHATVLMTSSSVSRPRTASTTDVVYDLLGEPEASIFSGKENSYVHHALIDLAKLTILAIKGPRFEFSEQSMLHILYPKFFPNIESDEWRPEGKVLLNYFEAQNGGCVTLKPLLAEFSSFITASLISFIRVAHPGNPWDLWVVQLIKTIVYELVCEDYAKSGHWRNHMISKSAVEVSRGLLIRNIKLAILCMALASSAFEKALIKRSRNVTNVNASHLDDDMRRSIELRKVGINILNYHLDEYDNNSEFEKSDGYDTYMMLALILQVQLDNAFGVFENYELLFAIGDFILKKESKHELSPVSKYLRNMFHVINVFYDTTQAINFFNYAITDKERDLRYLDLNENYDLIQGDSSFEKDDDSGSESETQEAPRKDIQVSALRDKSQPLSFTVHFNKNNTESELSASEEPEADRRSGNASISSRKSPISAPVIPLVDDLSIYVSWGLPKSLIQLFYEVTQLANHKNVFQTKGVTPRNFPLLCADLEDKIINWNVESYWKLHHNQYNPILNVATKIFISKFHEGLYYNVISFQNALLVYYKRLILTAPIQTYQNTIEKTLDAMEKLLGLDIEEDVKISPSFWPLLVSGCDIDLPNRVDLQERCQNLWKHECFSKYNYWRSKQILYEVWNRRNQEGDNSGFMDMVREWDIVLCLG